MSTPGWPLNYRPDGKLENESLVSHFPTGPTTTDTLNPSLFFYSYNRTFHLLQKPDTLICYQQGGRDQRASSEEWGRHSCFSFRRVMLTQADYCCDGIGRFQFRSCFL